MTQIEYGFRPTIYWKKGNRSKRNMNGAGSVVAIIGAFPCISQDILHFKDLEEARKELGIIHGKHDVEFKFDGTNFKRDDTNYYYGAAALNQVFLDNTNIQGASEVIVCNISTRQYKNGSPDCLEDNISPKYNRTLIHDKDEGNPRHNDYKSINYDKLTVALSKLKKEKFNNLVFAYPLDEITANDETINPVVIDPTTLEATPDTKTAKKWGFEDGDDPITKFLKRFRYWTRETYKVQHPIIGFFGVTTQSTHPFTLEPDPETGELSVTDTLVDSNKSTLINVDKVKAYHKVFEDEVEDVHSLGAIFTTGTYDSNAGYVLNPVESVAQFVGVLSGTEVDQSFTQRPVPTVGGIGLMKHYGTTNSYTEVYEELNFDPDMELKTDGFELLKSGAMMYECTNRNTKEYSIVSSTLPCGFDIAHVRTSAYIIEQIVLNPFLGKINNDTTLQAIDAVVTSIKNSMVERFPIVESILHTVEKVSPTCVRIRVHINFYGIILNEVVYMSVSVENQNRMLGKRRDD